MCVLNLQKPSLPLILNFDFLILSQQQRLFHQINNTHIQLLNRENHRTVTESTRMVKLTQLFIEVNNIHVARDHRTLAIDRSQSAVDEHDDCTAQSVDRA